jgi:hypothetical protein
MERLFLSRNLETQRTWVGGGGGGGGLAAGELDCQAWLAQFQKQGSLAPPESFGATIGEGQMSAAAAVELIREKLQGRCAA